MITSKPTPLSDLTSERRREIIANEVRTNATTPYSGTDGKPCLPLFDHPGIKDNTFLQQEIIRIATEYVDMLLLQDNVLDRGSKDDRMIQSLIKKEFVSWTTLLFDSLKTLASDDILANPNLLNDTDKYIKVSTHNMMAAIIKLSLVTKSKLNAKKHFPGDIPSAFGLESIPFYMEAHVNSYTKLLADETLLTRYAKQELANIKAAVRNSEIPVQSFISSNKQNPRAK